MAEDKTAKKTTTPTTSGVNAITGGVNYDSSSTSSGTPNPTAAAATPSGPNSLTDTSTIPAAPGIGSETTPSITTPSNDFPPIPSSVSSLLLPGGSQLGATPATVGKAGTPFQEKKIVDELAKELKVKASDGENLEGSVIEALAKKYDVKIPKPTQTEGTGTGQGTIGQARHAIAAWFSSSLPGTPGPQALGLNDKGTQPGAGEPEPIESKKALQEMLTNVSERLGIKGPADLADVAKQQGLPVASGAEPATPATAGGQQTVGQAYQSFLASASNSKGGLTPVGTAMATDLINANIIDQSQSTNLQAIAGGYAQVLTQAAQQGKSTTDVLNAGVAAAAGANSTGSALSEWSSYVQGIAGEFGVALDPSQINNIATTYYKQAVAAGVNPVADGPGAVTDAIKNTVVSLYNPNNPNDPAGVASQIFQGIKGTALQYGIPLSDAQLGSYVQSALQGQTVASMYTAKQSAIDQYTTLFQQQAASLYPSIAPQIQAGIPVSTIAQPYNSITQSITGKDAASIVTDPTDPDSAFLQGGKDPKTGAPAMMTLDQWKQQLMSDPSYGFQNTQGGKNLASQFASAILNEFGRVNTGSSQQGAFSAISQSGALAANS